MAKIDRKTSRAMESGKPTKHGEDGDSEGGPAGVQDRSFSQRSQMHLEPTDRPAPRFPAAGTHSLRSFLRERHRGLPKLTRAGTYNGSGSVLNPFYIISLNSCELSPVIITILQEEETEAEIKLTCSKSHSCQVQNH